jgi:hypothetical protein
MKRLLIAVLLVSCVWLASGQTLRVVLSYEADIGLPEPALLTLSEALVQGALDACFENGVIGTNDSPIAAALAASLAYKPGKDAVEGFVDYELIVHADFSKNGSAYSTPDCTFRLVRVSDLSTRYSSRLAAKAVPSLQKIDVDKACMLMGAEMVKVSLQGR